MSSFAAWAETIAIILLGSAVLALETQVNRLQRELREHKDRLGH